MSDSPLSIYDWLETPLGAALLEDEAHQVANALADVFGFQLLQIGRWGDEGQLLEHARTRQSTLVHRTPAPGVALCSDPGRLALAPGSVDAVMLPHTLEFDGAPHEVLREAARVLRGEGHLLTLGFNPWGLWGIRRLLARGDFPPASQRFISEGRMRDWMAILGFDVVKVVRYGYGLPSNRLVDNDHGLRLQSLGQALLPGLSGGYLMIARKRVYKVTPVRSVRVKKHVVGGLVEPAARTSAARTQQREL